MDEDEILCQVCKQTFTSKYFERHSIKCIRKCDSENQVADGFDVEMESPQEPTDEAIETENEIESNEADAEEELIDDQEAFEDMIRDFENEMVNDIEIGVEKN